MQDWYIEQRKIVEKSFETEKRLDDETEIVSSPCRKYSLEIAWYESAGVSRGFVRTMEGGTIADVKRNYGEFPYSWCENHPTGHDYLICGEDYQGQTVVELDTGRRVDHIPDEAEEGYGFCWVAHYPSPDGKFLFVDGCIWGCPYELILFDFSDPMTLPYREIKRWLVWENDGFQPDGSFQFRYYVLARRGDDKLLEEILKEEQIESFVIGDYNKLCGKKWTQVTWRPDGSEKVVELGFRD